MSASDGWISGISTTGFWTMVTVIGLALIGLVVLSIICTRKSNEGKPFKLKVSLKKVLTFEFESGQPTVPPAAGPVAEMPEQRPPEVDAPKLNAADPPKDAT